jgi:hypothetical protein
MLKLTFFYPDTLQPCWNRRFWPRNNPVMLKLMMSTTTHSSHAENVDFDHNAFQTCWN